MQVFSQLARRLMHEEHRKSVMGSASSDSTHAISDGRVEHQPPSRIRLTGLPATTNPHGGEESALGLDEFESTRSS